MGIEIRPEELRAKAGSMRKEVEGMRSALEVATRVVSQSEGAFEGSAANQVREKYNTLKPKFEDFYNAMDGYAEFLEKTAAAYEQRETEIKKKAEELTSDYSG